METYPKFWDTKNTVLRTMRIRDRAEPNFGYERTQFGIFSLCVYAIGQTQFWDTQDVYSRAESRQAAGKPCGALVGRAAAVGAAVQAVPVADEVHGVGVGARQAACKVLVGAHALLDEALLDAAGAAWHAPPEGVAARRRAA